MILDSLENRARYYALNPRLEKAFDYLLSTDLGALPAGRHAIDGDDVFINVMDVDLKRPADAKLEIHDRYLDNGGGSEQRILRLSQEFPR